MSQMDVDEDEDKCGQPPNSPKQPAIALKQKGPFLKNANSAKYPCSPTSRQHHKHYLISLSLSLSFFRDPDPPHCLAATAPIAQTNPHMYAAEGAPVTRIAFSSCLWSESVAAHPAEANQFWTDVRSAHACCFPPK